MSEKILQDCVDELFALQEQTTKNLKQFIQDAATLIKASQKFAHDAQEAALKAQAAAKQCDYAARQQLEQAVTYGKELSFWQRFGFWVGVGYVAFGVLMALVVMLSGYRLAERQAAIHALDSLTPIVLNAKDKAYVVIKKDSQHALPLKDGSRVYVAEVGGALKK